MFKNSKLRLFTAMLLSLVGHVLGFVVLWALGGLWSAPLKESSKAFEVGVQELPKELQERVELVKEPEPVKMVSVVPEPVSEPELFQPVPPEVKAVEQVTNAEEPEDANFVSAEANRVTEETRAERVAEVLSDGDGSSSAVVLKSNEPAQEDGGDEIEAGEEETGEAGGHHAGPESMDEGSGGVDERAKALFGMNMASAERVLGEGAGAGVVAEYRGKGQAKKRRLMPDFEQSQAGMKASLENFIHEIKPGNHTSVNAHANPAGDYLAQVHRRIHARWADDYLMSLDTRTPMSSPLRDPTLHTQLEFVIDAASGAVERVNIAKSSGNTSYDAAAVSVSMAAGPHPKPPKSVISPNGKIYIHWQFWRDTRQCGTYGAQVYLLNDG